MIHFICHANMFNIYFSLFLMKFKFKFLDENLNFLMKIKFKFLNFPNYRWEVSTAPDSTLKSYIPMRWY